MTSERLGWSGLDYAVLPLRKLGQARWLDWQGKVLGSWYWDFGGVRRIWSSGCMGCHVMSCTSERLWCGVMGRTGLETRSRSRRRWRSSLKWECDVMWCDDGFELVMFIFWNLLFLCCLNLNLAMHVETKKSIYCIDIKNGNGNRRVDQPVAKRLFPLIFFPYLKNRYGNGIIATVKKANKLVAPKPIKSAIAIAQYKSRGKILTLIAQLVIHLHTEQRKDSYWALISSSLWNVTNRVQHTTKTRSRKTIGGQRTGRIQRIGIDQEGENATEDQQCPARSKC